MKKEIIETIINTAALALTSFGVIQITTGNAFGYVGLSVGMILEFIKYFGRRKGYW